MNIIDTHGNMTMLNKDGRPVLIARLEFGANKSVEEKSKRAALLTIYPGHNGLRDLFLFTDLTKNPITFLQTPFLNPYLDNLYKDYMLNHTDKSISNLLSLVIKDYFIGKLGYAHPDYEEALRQLDEEITP